MDWTREAARDEALVKGLDLVPIGTDVTLGDDAASGLARTHNAKLARALEELDLVFSDCRSLGNPDFWTDRDSTDVTVALSRIRRARWDGLLKLSQVLRHRQYSLREVERHLERLRCARLSRAASARAARGASGTAGKTKKGAWKQESDAERLRAVEDALSAAVYGRCRALRDIRTVEERRREVFAALVG